MQYARLKHNLSFENQNKGNFVTLPTEVFREILSAAIYSTPYFDERFYLAQRPDVDAAIKKGILKSGRQHFAGTGYFEDLLPSQIHVDEEFYLKNNPDLILAFKSGRLASLHEHFLTNGYKEGRLPFMTFSIWHQE